MKHAREGLRQPYGGGHYALHRGGHGIYWQAGHGVVVRVAAAEHERETHRGVHPGERSPLEGLDDWRGVTGG